MIVVGVDMSLTSTGIACVEHRPIRVPEFPPHQYPNTIDAHRYALHRVQSKTGPNTVTARSVRLRTIAQNIIATATTVRPDVVVIEGPAYGSTTGKVWDRAGCWWLVVARLTGLGIPVVEVPPTVLKQYVLGKGAGKDTGKDNMLAAVINRYRQVEVTGNDTADALGLAAMGMRYYGHPIEPDLPGPNQRAINNAALRWPTITPT